MTVSAVPFLGVLFGVEAAEEFVLVTGAQGDGAGGGLGVGAV